MDLTDAEKALILEALGNLDAERMAIASIAYKLGRDQNPPGVVPLHAPEKTEPDTNETPKIEKHDKKHK